MHVNTTRATLQKRCLNVIAQAPSVISILFYSITMSESAAFFFTLATPFLQPAIAL